MTMPTPDGGLSEAVMLRALESIGRDVAAALTAITTLNHELGGVKDTVTRLDVRSEGWATKLEIQPIESRAIAAHRRIDELKEELAGDVTTLATATAKLEERQGALEKSWIRLTAMGTGLALASAGGAVGLSKLIGS